VQLKAQFWDGLVRADAPPGAPPFSTALIQDPRFDEPLLLNTALPLTGAQLQAFYLDRWPVEGLPLTAKQMVGAARQFVFAPESRQRLPALALVAGAILMYIAPLSPRSPRASGIARRSRRQAGYGESSPGCIVQTCRGCLSNSVKSSPSLRTCQKGCSATVDSRREPQYAMTCP
jgi:hypothetical protein